MKFINTSFIIQLFYISLNFLPSLISSQTCQKLCGQQSVTYPFGTGLGCGDQRFQKYVTCNQYQLTFTTHTGTYPITSIDYNNQVFYISDPSMSTCSCTQPSKGFSLDWDAPFSFHDNSIFALLDCSTSSASIYKSLNGENISASDLCDPQGAFICNHLYSCQAVSRLNIPISTCCVYTPVDLGPSFEMDLDKLKCSSYSGLYGFDGQENNPENWKYGVAIKYKFNLKNEYPIMCDHCEKSNGVCGYNGPYSSFSCNCPGDFNTTTDCSYGQWQPLGSAFRVQELQTVVTAFACLFGLMLV